METQKNILIENGILKNYLIDELNNRKLKMQPTEVQEEKIIILLRHLE